MKESFWDISKSSSSAQAECKYAIRLFFSAVIPTDRVSVSSQHEIASDNTALWKEVDTMRTLK